MNEQVFCDLVTINPSWRPWLKVEQYERGSISFDTFKEAHDYALNQIFKSYDALSITGVDYEVEQWNTEKTYFIAIYNGPRLVMQYEIYPYEGDEYDDLPF